MHGDDASSLGRPDSDSSSLMDMASAYLISEDDMPGVILAEFLLRLVEFNAQLLQSLSLA
jgi:hypothetical protein